VAQEASGGRAGWQRRARTAGGPDNRAGTRAVGFASASAGAGVRDTAQRADQKRSANGARRGATGKALTGGSLSDMRDGIVLAAVLGPCRAQTPYV